MARLTYKMSFKIVNKVFMKTLVLSILLATFPLLAMAQASGGQIRRQGKKQSISNNRRSVTLANPVQKLSCPDGNHPHMIDLGLPSGTKWACCNLGASTPEQSGNYYRCGETEPFKEGDTDATYPYKGVDIGNNIAGTKYDAATANWGASWRMPTENQMKELMHNCTYKWTTLNGVKGGKVTGRKGRTIFFPASGSRRSSSLFNLDYVGSYGYYWSASPYSGSYGHRLGVLSGSWNWGGAPRAFGFPVRPVAK